MVEYFLSSELVLQHALVRRNLGLIASLLQTLKNAYMRYNTVHHHGVSPTQLVEMQAPTADALDSSKFSDPAFLPMQPAAVHSKSKF